MQPPSDPRLPFFVYGLFKPDQLGYFRIAALVSKCVSGATVQGQLWERDGLPLLHPQAQGRVPGALITFNVGREFEAYSRIGEMEPDKQYYWATAPVSLRGAKITANILHGKSPTKGSVPLETPDWDGRDDPLFTTALAVVEETLRANEQFAWDLKPLFRLEMAYLLLWSSIERYTSLRYHLGKDATAKVLNIAEEPAFVAALKEVVREKRTLYRADEPQHSVTLRADQPKKSLAYYYQIRNNAIHRGKAVGRDFDILREALDQLLRIFTCVLQAAFHECQAGENHT